MASEYVGPLIAAVAGLAVVAIQLLAGRRTARELETLKNRLASQHHKESEHLKLYLQRYAEGQSSSLEGFRQYLTAVQELKDRCRRVVNSPRSFAPISLAAELAELTAAVSRTLGNAQLWMAPEDYQIAHELKHRLFDLVHLASECHRVNAVESAQIPDSGLEIRTHFEGVRTQVDAIHQDLRVRAREAAASYIRSMEEKQDEG